MGNELWVSSLPGIPQPSTNWPAGPAGTAHSLEGDKKVSQYRIILSAALFSFVCEVSGLAVAQQSPSPNQLPPNVRFQTGPPSSFNYDTCSEKTTCPTGTVCMVYGDGHRRCDTPNRNAIDIGPILPPELDSSASAPPACASDSDCQPTFHCIQRKTASGTTGSCLRASVNGVPQ